MNSFIFLESIRAIKGTKTNFIILYLSNIICFILPVILSITVIVLNTIHISGFPQPINQTIILQLPEQIPPTLREDLEVSFKEIEATSLSISLNEIIYSDHAFGSVLSIVLTDQFFYEFYGDEFVTLPHQEACAIIGQGSVETLFPDIEPIGEVIYFNNNAYPVVSVTNNIRYANRIVIIDPDMMRENVFKPSFVGVNNRLYLRIHNDADQEQLLNDIHLFTSDRGLVVSPHLAKDLFLEEGGIFDHYILIISLVGTLLILFVLSNLSNVVSLLADQKGFGIGIKLALGVSYGRIVIENLISFAIVGLLSLVTTFAVVYLAISIFSGQVGLEGHGPAGHGEA